MAHYLDNISNVSSLCILLVVPKTGPILRPSDRCALSMSPFPRTGAFTGHVAVHARLDVSRSRLLAFLRDFSCSRRQKELALFRAFLAFWVLAGQNDNVAHFRFSPGPLERSQLGRRIAR